jgi:hypothetical protein
MSTDKCEQFNDIFFLWIIGLSGLSLLCYDFTGIVEEILQSDVNAS